VEPSEGWGDASEGAVGIDAKAEGLADCQPGVGTHSHRHGEPVVVDGHSAGVREQATDACGQLDERRWGRGVRCGTGRGRPIQHPRRIQPRRPLLILFAHRQAQRGAESIYLGKRPFPVPGRPASSGAPR
jgi:hypothetical protein